MASTGDGYCCVGGSLIAIDVREWQKLQDAVEQLRAELARLHVPNFFWDDRHLESAAETIDEGVAFDDPGKIVELRPLHELPTIFVLVTEDGHAVFDSREEAEKAAVAMTEEE